MSESIQAPPAPSSKVLIITSLITAATTIGVSFVGVVPQLRRQDNVTISSLQQKLQQIEQSVIPTAAGKEVVNVAPGRKQTIRGTVTSSDGKRLKTNIEVSLVPVDPRLTDTTNNNGEFVFAGIPAGVYKIIVREADGRSVSTYLDEDRPNLPIALPISGADTLIRYSVRDKGDQ